MCFLQCLKEVWFFKVCLCRTVRASHLWIRTTGTDEGEGGKWKLGSDLQLKNLVHKLDFSVVRVLMKIEIVFAGLIHDYNVNLPFAFKIRLLIHAWLPESALHQPSLSLSLPSCHPQSPHHLQAVSYPPKLPFSSSHYSGSCRWCYNGTAWWLGGLQASLGSHQLSVIEGCSFLSCY